MYFPQAENQIKYFLYNFIFNFQKTYRLILPFLGLVSIIQSCVIFSLINCIQILVLWMYSRLHFFYVIIITEYKQEGRSEGGKAKQCLLSVVLPAIVQDTNIMKYWAMR